MNRNGANGFRSPATKKAMRVGYYDLDITLILRTGIEWLIITMFRLLKRLRKLTLPLMEMPP